MNLIWSVISDKSCVYMRIFDIGFCENIAIHFISFISWQVLLHLPSAPHCGQTIKS